MTYDLVVIGSGPGGYVCAIRAAYLGLRVALVEKETSFGGTCLNVGCIPSKALLYASEIYQQACHGFTKLGVKIASPELDLAAMMAHKRSVVAANTAGVAYLLKKNKIDNFIGFGKIVALGQVEVTMKDGASKQLVAKNIVIATGSEAATIPGIDMAFDEDSILSSTGALSLEKVPETMLIIGAGVIGCELGSVWQRLGAKVTLIEFQDKVLGAMDHEISQQFQKLMEKQGLHFRLGEKVTAIHKKGDRVIVSCESIAKGTLEDLEAHSVLVATGRRPFTAGLGLENVNIELDKAGFIPVDRNWRCHESGIYAIGDVVGGSMLAHKAEDEGVAVAEILVNQAGHVNYSVIPSVIYTQPEVASIGKTEEELRQENMAYHVGKFPFSANGRARAMNHTEGFVKILSCAKTDRVVGAHILGAGAGEMIHELAVLMEFGGSSEDLARTCHAHPTLSEIVREAAFAAFSKPIHL